jgi:uncharacterized protein
LEGVTEVTGIDSNTTSLEEALRDHVQKEEASYDRDRGGSDSLWDHLLRTAAIAEKLGRSEGLDPALCRLAGLFHDAGKFHRGELHDDDVPEEQRSVEVFRHMAAEHGISPDVLEPIAEAILQLYRDDPDPTPLARVLFDADNLDKLGPLGIANFFVKRGLRGRAVSPSFLFRFTVELTYARHAADCMLTEAGRKLASRRGTQSEAFLRSLLGQLREDGLADFVIEEVDFEGLVLSVVEPRNCLCGGDLRRKLWQIPGIKCLEIHVAHDCVECEKRHEIRFCRPRLA